MHTISHVEIGPGVPSQAPYADLNNEWYTKLCPGAVLIIANVYRHAVFPANLRIASYPQYQIKFPTQQCVCKRCATQCSAILLFLCC